LAGAGLLGWTSATSLPPIRHLPAILTGKFGAKDAHQVEIASAIAGVWLVLLVGGLWRRSRQRQQPAQENV